MTIYYKLHHLGKDNEVKKIYIFTGSDDPKDVDGMKDYDEDQKKKVVFVNDLIYPDDTVDIIKRKLIRHISNISYHEIHMFAINETIMTYRHFTNQLFKKNSKRQSEHMNVIKSNLADDEIKRGFSLTDAKTVDYSALSSIDFSEPFVRYISIDKKFSGDNEFMDSVTNPFTIEDDNFFLSSGMVKNNFVSLVSYGDIKDNTIYFCDAETTIEAMGSISEEKIINYYFPSLREMGVFDVEELNKRRSDLIEMTKSKHVDAYMNVIDSYYSLYDDNKESVEEMFPKHGIVRIEFEILNVDGTTLPFDILYKNIHASKKYPMVKTVNNKNSDKIVRFYSEKTNKNGDKIPYMESPEIFRALKMIPNIRGVYLYIPIRDEVATGTMVIGIRDSGDIYIKLKFTSHVTKSYCENIVRKNFDEFIKSINVYFIKVGYDAIMFDGLDNANINILNIDYSYLNPNKKKGKGKVSKIKTCMKEIMEYSEKDSMLLSKNQHVFNFKKYIRRGADEKNRVLLKLDTGLDNTILTIHNMDSFEYLNVLPVYLSVVMMLLNDTLGSEKEKSLCFKKSSKMVAPIEDNTEVVAERLDESDTLNEGDLDNMFSFNDEDGGLDLLIGDSSDDGEEGKVLGDDGDEGEGEGLGDEGEGKGLGDDGDDGDDGDEEEGEGLEEGQGEDDEDIESFDLDGMDDEDDIETFDLGGMDDEDNEDNEDDKDDDDIETFNLDNLDDNGDGDGDEDGDGNGDGDDDIESFNLDDMNDDESDSEKKGGAKKERKLWVNRIEQRDNIFDKFKYPGKEYSRTCPSNQNRQPVIVTKEEFDEINEKHPGSYYPEEGTFEKNPDKDKFSIKYHTKKDEEYYYICPKFWCVDENVAMNIKNDLKLNKDGTEYRNKDGNVESKKPGFCKNIHEFGVKYSQASDKDKKIVDDKGGLTKNAFYYPSFKEDNYCLPCCYKYSDRTPDHFGNPQKKADTCMKTIHGETDKKPISKKEYRTNPYTKILSVILQSDKFPLPPFRGGYLNITTQNMFRFKGMVCDDSHDTFDCHLRVGVEESETQSFVSAMACIYKFALNKGKTVSVDSFKRIIYDNISIDHFIKLQNGNLISLFDQTPIKYDATTEASLLYQKLSVGGDDETAFFKRICNSFVHFKDNLLKDDVLLDHTILWDLMCGDFVYLFENGMNLVIFETTQDDADNYVKLLCPSNYYSSTKFDISKKSGKKTVFLIKHGSKYEPIARVTSTSTDPKINFFIDYKSNTSSKVSSEYELLKKISSYSDNCYPIPSIPSLHNYDTNVIRMKDEIFDYLKRKKYTHIKQVLNYRGKVVGFSCEKKIKGKTIRGMIPCYPGYIDVNMDISFYNDNSNYNTYNDTISFMKFVSSESDTTIYVDPLKKVLRKGNIVGFMTPLNHFVKIHPSVVDNTDDDYESTDVIFIGKEDEFMDTLIYENMSSQDKKRSIYVKKIRLENFIFTMFRHKFKGLLENPENIETKNEILTIINTRHYMFDHKINKIKKIVRDIMIDHCIFVDKFNDAFLEDMDIQNIHEYIIDSEDDKILVPSKNLTNENSNEDMYFIKLSDELVRFPSLRKYILDPNGYIEAINDEYNISPNEVIFPESSITRELLTNIDRWSSYNHPYETAFDTVSPLKTVINKRSVDYKNPVKPTTSQPPRLKKAVGGKKRGTYKNVSKVIGLRTRRRAAIKNK